MRLDIKLHEMYPDISRAQLQRFIKDGKVLVNKHVETVVKRLISEADKIKLDSTALLPQKHKKISIPILYEDADCVVIEKPVGILTHSKGAYNSEATVASWLKSKTKGFNDGDRDGIVHRLDRATSGVMIVAKNPESLIFIQKQFSLRKVKKTYNALIIGSLEPEEAIIDIPIERNPQKPQRFRVSSEGKKAVTKYKLIKSFIYKDNEFSLIKLEPKTGRTHQLRVHLAHIKHPIVGDTFYNGINADRLYLHSMSLELSLTNGQKHTFKSKLPSQFYKPKISI